MGYFKAVSGDRHPAMKIAVGIERSRGVLLELEISEGKVEKIDRAVLHCLCNYQATFRREV